MMLLNYHSRSRMVTSPDYRPVANFLSQIRQLYARCPGEGPLYDYYERSNDILFIAD